MDVTIYHNVLGIYLKSMTYLAFIIKYRCLNMYVAL